MPEVYTDIEKTDLRIWNIDFADSYPELGDEAKDILGVILKSNIPMSVSRIREGIGLSDYKVRKWLELLEEKKLVQRVGSGPATRYAVRETSDEKITQLQIALDNLKIKE
ncbi:MAG: FaeA/PapI family transcriptional regulator [Roseburia sp.]|nr:FaeA/PapI family transcriptional regulator [Roseburia sp.]